jgi:hypothetical protein
MDYTPLRLVDMARHISAWWNSLLLSLGLRLLARSYSVVSIYAPKREGIEPDDRDVTAVFFAVNKQEMNDAALDYVESESL